MIYIYISTKFFNKMKKLILEVLWLFAYNISFSPGLKIK